MKKLLLFAVILFASCGRESVYIGCGNPFVVESINKHDTFNSEYITNKYNRLFGWRAKIIAKTGLYNIGDTIKLKLKTY